MKNWLNFVFDDIIFVYKNRFFLFCASLNTLLTGDLDAIRHMIAWVIRMIIESFSLFGATMIYFLFMDWRLALTIIAIAPFIFWIIWLFKRRVAPQHRKLREKFALLNTVVQENISGNRVVKAFAREDYEIEKFNECNVDYSKTNKETAFTWLRYFPVVETFANLMPVVLLVVGGLFLIEGQLTVGQYAAFSGLIWAIANPMRNLGNIMNEFQRFDAAAADDFISKMPDGYDTVVGERGVGLSGGQKQRISLARALAIKPAILILDDTTSAVDLETEKIIQEGLNNLDFECTKIIIAQRISTTKNADKIIVLQDGRIKEMGTHAELIAKRGYYYDVVQLQIGNEEVM